MVITLLFSRTRDVYSPPTSDSLQPQITWDPKKGVEVMIDIIKGEGIAAGRDFQTVVALGGDCDGGIKPARYGTLQHLEVCKVITVSTDFPNGS